MIPSIAPHEFAAVIDRGLLPLVIDVRRAHAFEAGDCSLAQALRRPPETAAEWAHEIEAHRMVIAACVHGHEVGQTVAATLRAHGLDARFLEGGIEGWRERGLPVARKPGNAPSAWITRARPKIDRIACPWLIRRFLDPDARIRFVPADQVAAEAARTGATPFDVEGFGITHRGSGCSFDSFLEDYGLDDPGLRRLAPIIRSADTARLDLAPEAAGLLAVSLGISARAGEDDEAALRAGFPVYDALYAWARAGIVETHSWPPSAAHSSSMAVR